MRSLMVACLLGLASASWGEVLVENAFVRAMPPGQPNTAAFMLMKNTNDAPVRLTKVSTPVAKKAEFHSHSKDSHGVMRMRKEAYVDIPAQGAFEFKSGGHHIMLMGLTRPLKVDETVSITVEDNEGQTYSFTLPVRSIVASQSQHHHHHH